jgi:hypothetical protein
MSAAIIDERKKPSQLLGPHRDPARRAALEGARPDSAAVEVRVDRSDAGARGSTDHTCTAAARCVGDAAS